MKLITKRKYADTEISELQLPHYYRLDSNMDKVYGCITKDNHVVIKRLFDQQGNVKFELEKNKIDAGYVSMTVNTYYETLQVSSKEEFTMHLISALQFFQSILDELNIKF